MKLFYQKDDCLQNVILALEWAKEIEENGSKNKLNSILTMINFRVL